MKKDREVKEKTDKNRKNERKDQEDGKVHVVRECLERERKTVC